MELLEPASGVGIALRLSSMPYLPGLSCEQVEANLAWVAESATVGPALWAEARAHGLLGEEIPLPSTRCEPSCGLVTLTPHRSSGREKGFKVSRLMRSVLGHSPRSHVLTDTVRGVCGVECGWHELIDQFSYEQAVRWSALGVGRGSTRHVAP